MTLAFSGKRRRREVILVCAAAVLLGCLFGLSSQGQHLASAATTLEMSPVSASCSEDFFGGLVFATDNDPDFCTNTTAQAVGGLPDGNYVNVETDDLASDDQAVGEDQLIVRFDLSGIPAGRFISAATLKVWSVPSDDPGVLEASLVDVGGSRYGSFAPGSSPANYSRWLADDIGRRGPGLFEIGLTMDCLPNSDDCGALIDAALLEVTFGSGGSITSITKTHTGDGIYSEGEVFNWIIAFEVTGGELEQGRSFIDELPSEVLAISHVGGTGCYSDDGLALFCGLPTGLRAGRYWFEFSVKVAGGAPCGPVVNELRETTAQGAVVATDAVEISCGTGTPTSIPTVTATVTTSPSPAASTSPTASTTSTPSATATQTPTSTGSSTPTTTPGGSTSTATSTPTRTATPTTTPTSTAALKYKLRTMQLARDGFN